MLTKIFSPELPLHRYHDILKEIKRLNTTLEKLVETWQDSNIIASKYTGHKVSYKKPEEFK